MYKLWKSINTSETEPCVCVKHMVGQIIPQATTIQKAVIDDIINAVDGFEPGITMSSANWKHWVAQLDLYTCKYCKKCMGKYIPWKQYYWRAWMDLRFTIGVDVLSRH